MNNFIAQAEALFYDGNRRMDANDDKGAEDYFRLALHLVPNFGEALDSLRSGTPSVSTALAGGAAPLVLAVLHRLVAIATLRWPMLGQWVKCRPVEIVY